MTKKQFLNITMVLIFIIGVPVLIYSIIPKQKSARKFEEPKQYDLDKNISGKNMLTENFDLLASKYGIRNDQLIEILVHYEKMTGRFGFATIFFGLKSGQTPKIIIENIVDINSALDTISKTFQIEKKILASIIIDYKLLQRDTKSE